MANWQVGDKVTLTATFTNAGVVADPDTVRVIIQSPAGTEATYVYNSEAQPTKSSTGVYVFTLHLTSAGDWYYRFDDGTPANGNTAVEGLIGVDASVFVV